MGTYYSEVNHNVAVADLTNSGSFVCPLLVSGRLSGRRPIQQVRHHGIHLTFQRRRIENLLKEKFITLPADHKLPTKEELKGKEYCKYQHSWNHSTNSCWSFRNAVQEKIKREFLSSQKKLIDEDPH
jgi:hypothetical protein